MRTRCPPRTSVDLSKMEIEDGFSHKGGAQWANLKGEAR